MELNHKFTVPASVEDTWTAFTDIESVAGCFPGATVTSVEGEEFKGTCKVKLGPIALVYAGSGQFLERDESAHRFVIEAKGKDKRGNGTAGATVTAVMTTAGAGSTDVEVNTDLAITGKPAQFGRGVIQDVSDKLLQQFVTCLESTVGAPEPVAATGTTGDSSVAVAAEAAAAGEPGVTASGADDSGGRHLAESAGSTGATRKAPATTYSGVSAGGEPVGTVSGRTGSEDPLDLGATVLPILLKSYWKPLVGGLLALILLRWLARRRS